MYKSQMLQPHQVDAGVSVVHGGNLAARIQGGQFGDAGFEAIELRGVGFGGNVLKRAGRHPAVVANAEIRDSSQNVFSEGSFGVDDIGGDHRGFEAAVANGSDEAGKVLPDAIGLHVAALADGEVDAIETDFGGGFSQLIAFEELKMFGKDADFEFCGAGIVGGMRRKRPT